MLQHPVDPRNWVEDFTHENGNYGCRCVVCLNKFVGHKRRVVCKVCDLHNRKELTDEEKTLLNNQCVEQLKEMGLLKEDGSLDIFAVATRAARKAESPS